MQLQRKFLILSGLCELWKSFTLRGIPISQYQQKNLNSRPFKQILIALDRDRDELYHRIDTRMDQMLDQGLVDEAKSVIEFRDTHALQTVGYKEVYGWIWMDCIMKRKWCAY